MECLQQATRALQEIGRFDRSEPRWSTLASDEGRALRSFRMPGIEPEQGDIGRVRARDGPLRAFPVDAGGICGRSWLMVAMKSEMSIAGRLAVLRRGLDHMERAVG